MYSEIADELNDIVDEERHAIDNATQAAERSGDERRAETARDTAADRNFRLDMLPDDLAGKVRELQAYDFESAEARATLRATARQDPPAADAADGRADVAARCRT